MRPSHSPPPAAPAVRRVTAGPLPIDPGPHGPLLRRLAGSLVCDWLAGAGYLLHGFDAYRVPAGTVLYCDAERIPLDRVSVRQSERLTDPGLLVPYFGGTPAEVLAAFALAFADGDPEPAVVVSEN